MFLAPVGFATIESPRVDPGARVPASASLTIVVGQGITEESSDTIVDMAVADDTEAEVLDLD